MNSKVLSGIERPKPPNAGKGRVKGVPNKTTKAVKEALAEAFEGMGGVEKLQAWAEENPALFYPLWVKMLPLDVKADVGGQIVVTWQPAK